MGFYVNLAVLSLLVLGISGQITPSDGCIGGDWQCPSGRCIPSRDRCDGIDDCGDGADERNCPDPALCHSIPSDQCSDPTVNAACPNLCQSANVCDSGCDCTNQGGFCIPAHQKCTILGGSDCKPSNKGCKCCLKPTVYKQDIENTVAFFLNMTMYNITTGNTSILNQTLQNDLKNIIDTFAQHLPPKPFFENFLNCVSDRLSPSNGIITGHDLNQFYYWCGKRGERPKLREWVGCKNRAVYGWARFRSYPCGVWTTFHTITVDILRHPSPHKPGKSILPILHKLVNNFPWCNMCKDDFLSMYKNLDGGNPNMTPEDAVMWLWKGHNRVTARTATSFDENKEHIWENGKCLNLGDGPKGKLLSKCKLLCKLEQRCTAFNYGGPSSECQLRGCGYPVTRPFTHKSGWQAYNIITGNGTDQGRSHWQFPGVNQCPGCQSLTPPGPPSTGCGYPQVHQVDGCFDRGAVLAYLKTMYSTFY